ncbi:MAG: hypothetical protein KIT10_08625 [Flavobacteriales bacterium]|nr:hypothetical protein [Flavobacteriales bacterium]
MLHRFLLLCTFPVITAIACAQATLVQMGEPFTKTLKGSSGDLFTVVDGIFAADGRHILFVEEGLTPKVVRLDAQLRPTEELVLKDIVADGLKWTAVTPIVSGNSMRCLFVSSNKKESVFGVAAISTGGALAVEAIRRLATFELPYANDPSNTMVARPLPDPILFTRGLAYAQQERLVSSPDGKLHLLSHHSHKGKGNKRFAFACLDSDLRVQWEGAVELPFADNKSTIHQIAVDDGGTIHVLTYLFQCKSEEQLGDKNCHELHLSVISAQGREARHVLLEKGFVSSARILPRGDGRIAMALRYGALTGLPGMIVQFDLKEPKLKPTPITAQRLPSIRKTKLMAFGDPAADPRKPLPRTAKVANDIVALWAVPDGGLHVVETFLDPMFQLQMADAIAIRHLSGHVRMGHVGTNDSITWQRESPRALLTTAGPQYHGTVAMRRPEGTWLFHGQTPKGYEAILRAGSEGASGRGDAPAEPQVLRAALIDDSGKPVREGTALLMTDDFVPCPMGMLLEPDGMRALVKLYDRGTGYRFALVDLARLGE